MKLITKNIQGQLVKSIDASNRIFGAKWNPTLVHQVMVGQLANKRQGTASTKTRAEVAGGVQSRSGKKVQVEPEPVLPDLQYGVAEE